MSCIAFEESTLFHHGPINEPQGRVQSKNGSIEDLNV